MWPGARPEEHGFVRENGWGWGLMSQSVWMETICFCSLFLQHNFNWILGWLCWAFSHLLWPVGGDLFSSTPLFSFLGGNAQWGLSLIKRFGTKMCQRVHANFTFFLYILGNSFIIYPNCQWSKFQMTWICPFTLNP